MQTKKLGLTPTLIVLLAVLGLAFLVGVIFLMMLVRTGIEHSPEQSSLELNSAAPAIWAGPAHEIPELPQLREKARV